jgi:protein TonB
MKNLKKLPTKQLEKFSTIFTQLGLVLVLFVVYTVLEHKTPEKPLAVIDFDPPETVSIEPDLPYEFTREPKPKLIIETLSSAPFIVDEPIKKEDNNIIETLINLPKDDELEQIDINTLVTVDEPMGEEPPETVEYIIIQNAPIFKGCEGLSKEKNKKCFDKKMKRFVQRNFNVDVARNLGLNSGKYRISSQFIIDDKGNVVDVEIKAPHIKLKKDTKKLIEKLPQFIPGMQSNKPVKVRYILPITFVID